MMMVLALEIRGNPEIPGVSYSCVTLQGEWERGLFWFEASGGADAAAKAWHREGF